LSTGAGLTTEGEVIFSSMKSPSCMIERSWYFSKFLRNQAADKGNGSCGNDLGEPSIGGGLGVLGFSDRAVSLFDSAWISRQNQPRSLSRKKSGSEADVMSAPRAKGSANHRQGKSATIAESWRGCAQDRRCEGADR
jgi:hypothetical protein